MRLLLDTHVLVWFLGGERLSERLAGTIRARENEVIVSAASVWEAEIKAAAGRLELTGDLLRGVKDSDLTELPISFEHGRKAARLPRHHGDPFDRVLIAQAQLEGLTIATRDAAFTAYDVQLLAA